MVFCNLLLAEIVTAAVLLKDWFSSNGQRQHNIKHAFPSTAIWLSTSIAPHIPSRAKIKSQLTSHKVDQGCEGPTPYRWLDMGTNMTWRTFSERFVFSVTSKYPGVMASLGNFVGRNPLICLMGPMTIALFVFTATFNIWSHEATLEQLFIPFDSKALTGGYR